MADTKAPPGSGEFDERPEDVRKPPAPSSQPQEILLPLPPSTVIGKRYRVEEPLGHGGFGQVYLCTELKTETRVAVKLLRPEHASGPRSQEIVQQFLNEAKILAQFEHPNIVHVRDWGQTDEIPVFIAMDYIDGISLAQRLRQTAPVSDQEAARWMIDVAKALQYAHARDVFHLDVKPANILFRGDILARGPQDIVLVDFGLALRDQHRLLRSGRISGTPAYMSREQARGESRRIGPHTDVYGLGATLYAILVGRPPFQGDSDRETLALIEDLTVRPQAPKTKNPNVDPELDRICMKALSKLALDRYPSAQAMLDDLREFLRTRDASVAPAVPTAPAQPAAATAPASSREPEKIVPRGLKPFGGDDAYFFLRLLPGPRDRNGLPESIHRWTSKIEAADHDEPFSVGIIYGPSGCGKSSLVRAGLLPRLNENRVRSVYVRATAGKTEQVLWARLHRQFPSLAPGLDLVEMIRAVDEGPPGAGDVKALIVLDQFEQWLAVHSAEQETELLNALRLCSQSRVQCLLLVRDGFLITAQRFVRSLDVTLDERRNWAAMDLFSTDHAVAVLTEFGRAWDKFDNGRPGAEQIQFMKQAVAALAKDGQVICVALALYADMIKDQPWTLATFEGAGDLKEVGRTFLERSLGPSSGRRPHEKAARRVLESLLPPGNVKIINRRRTRDELQQASGYATRPEKYDELIKILTDDLPLVMEVEADDDEDEGDRQTQESPELAPVQYRITHEYLVDPLRAWVEKGDTESIRGRAKLALRKRTEEWKASASKEPKKRDPAYLPSLFEYGRILCFAPRSEFGDDQRDLMRTARRRYAKWGGVLSVPALILSLIAGFLVWDQLAATRVHALKTAPPHAVSSALAGLDYYGPRARPRCRHVLQSPDSDAQAKLHSALYLAQFPADREHAQDFLVTQILAGPERECANIVAALAHAPDPAMKKIEAQFYSAQADQQVRLATVALHLGSPGLAKDMLQLRENPEMRTAFIHGYPGWYDPGWYGDMAKVAETLGRDDVDPHFSSGLCNSLGLIARHVDRSAAKSMIETLRPVLLRLYEHAPDGGTHSAAWFALQRWQEIEPSLQIPVLEPRQPSAGENPAWFVNTQGTVMIRIPHGSFTRGDDSRGAYADEKPHKVTLTEDFHISDREVTVRQFREFCEKALEAPTCTEAEKEIAKNWEGEERTVSPAQDCPVQRVSWFEAVAFCNWLSRSEGLTPCYSLSKTGVDDGWKCDQDAHASGYRLPTEALWEYACRAVSQKRYAFGDDAEGRLREYANFAENSDFRTWPTARKLPNGWGLFDMHGNVWEWCWDRFGEYPEGAARSPRRRRRPPWGLGRSPSEFENGRVKIGN